ncbi:MAG: methylmalonyl-CoA mutase [Chloroflexi bacterium]|nr:methylmalonyl-CoA mutase [Chloroflexota bacterium]MBM3172114.1 methylmalonyl-CoA mutase [Chloroflexota bacterium]MBM3175007.1 methylmalonyl-CoA mutase [Chloroflexota bacterium]MBM4449367.1 methylmalonyl-CoA mutase [Chloroflexota bacterium]
MTHQVKPDLERKARHYHAKSESCQERQKSFATTSGVPIQRLHSPLDLPDFDYLRDLTFPGEYPFTRGVHYTGHRGKLWTMRMFAGFGCAEETNARYKYLLQHGETGLSVAFDFPTLNGYDSSDPEARGEFGKCGVAVSSLADMEILFDGIPIDEITTSMTINGPAAVIWAMYLANAQKRGIPLEKLGGTIQNDILKEYIAQNAFIFPPAPSMKLIVDTFEFGMKRVPRWNTISISGYHIREAGATAVQELAFTLADGLAYVQAGMDRGLKVDDFAPRLSFFFNCHNDLFEEIAKFRAARRIWAREMKKRYHAGERSQWLRFHTQTAGCSLTAQQPENNIVRTTIQALAAVLGNTQSLHTNSMDEALALPSEKAVTIALRTQQIIAHESGVTNTIDPLGGSYFVEALTNQTEKAAYEYFARIDALGGVIPAIEAGFFHREIADSAYRYQQEIDSHKRTIVGVNDYVVDEPIAIPILQMDKEGEKRQMQRLSRIRRERDNELLSSKLEALRQAATKGTENLMPYLIEAVSAYGTLGEVCGVLRKVYGEYRLPALV